MPAEQGGPKAEQGGPKGFQVVDEGQAPGRERPAAKRPQPLPPLTFGSFVLSLSASALVHLGEAPSPETGKQIEPNLVLAQQAIEMLEMIEEKTRGNLDPDEQRLLESVLHDLRMRFVEAGAQSGKDST